MRVARIRRALHALALLAAACGGGGSGGSGAVPPQGLAGRALLSDHVLGRVIEQEPNDAPEAPGALPPVPPRAVLEVTGTLAEDGDRYGRADPADAFALTFLSGSEVELRLSFGPLLDPEGPGFNRLFLEVREPGTGDLLASTASGLSPQTTGFRAAPGVPYRVLVACAEGHAAWTLRVAASDPPGAGKPPLPVAVARWGRGSPVSAEFDLAHVLVRLAPGADPDAVARRHGLLVGARTAAGSWRLGWDAGSASPTRPLDVSARLSADADVLWAEPDRVVRPSGGAGDPDLPRQWNLRAVGAEPAWGVTVGDPSVVVGVLDTGVTPHASLEGRLVDGYDFVSDPVTAADGDGRDPDPTDPGDLGRSSGLSTWHGTAVASLLVGARGDGEGIAGLAPGCRAMPLRVLGRGGGRVSDVADAILFAAGLFTTADGRRLDAPLRVLNMSLGVGVDSAELFDACERATAAGVLIVAAAGNTGGPVQHPAAYASVLAVGAVDGAFARTPYSAFGPSIDLCAPGGRTTDDQADDGWPDGALVATVDETRDPPAPSLAYVSGTSLACPLVAGAAALLLSEDPSLSAQELRDLLTGTALDLGTPGRDDAHGAGLLRVHEALRRRADLAGAPLAAPPALHLLRPSVRFVGLEEATTVPVTNGGGGLLSVVAVDAETDAGASWLSASLLPAPPGSACDVSAVEVRVDRDLLPAGRGCHSGTLRLSGPAGVLASLRVVACVEDWVLAGRDVAVFAEEVESGSTRASATASAANAYRWEVHGLAEAEYRVQAGVDLDGDGETCEPFDPCGWFGGPAREDAVPLSVEPYRMTVGVDVVLFSSGP